MNILVLNSGSSSIKFQVVQTDQAAIAADGDLCLAKGQIERIGGLALVSFQATGRPPFKEDAPLRDYRTALDRIVRWVISPESGIEGIKSMADIHIIGHRVVHGGEKFRSSTVINDAVLEGIEDCIELAPLHNPANIRGIRAAAEVFGRGVPQVAVFDTAFHATMPETAYLYGIPYHLYRRYKIRRYGFHGTSHRQGQGEHHHIAPGQRLLGLRDQGRGLRQHEHGVHAARRHGDGHAGGGRRRLGDRIFSPQGRAEPARHDHHAQQAVRPARALRPDQRHARTSR
jgi:acetate kinase